MLLLLDEMRFLLQRDRERERDRELRPSQLSAAARRAAMHGRNATALDVEEVQEPVFEEGDQSDTADV